MPSTRATTHPTTAIRSSPLRPYNRALPIELAPAGARKLEADGSSNHRIDLEQPDRAEPPAGLSAARRDGWLPAHARIRADPPASARDSGAPGQPASVRVGARLRGDRHHPAG